MNNNKCIKNAQGEATVLTFDYLSTDDFEWKFMNSILSVVVKLVGSTKTSCHFRVCQDSCLLELHQSFGTDYVTVAAGHIRMQDLLEKCQGRLHGTIQLTGTVIDF